MYEVRYGAKYHESQGKDASGNYRYLGAAEIAKLMRADIKAEIEAGNLPKANYSVRVQNYAGGRSIDLTVRDLEGAWVPENLSLCDPNYCRTYSPGEPSEYTQHYSNRCPGAEHLSDEAERVLEIVKSIHAAYNFDGSEAMVDYFHVNYYGHAEIESPWHAKWRLKEKDEKSAKRVSKNSWADRLYEQKASA